MGDTGELVSSAETTDYLAGFLSALGVTDADIHNAATVTPPRSYDSPVVYLGAAPGVEKDYDPWAVTAAVAITAIALSAGGSVAADSLAGQPAPGSMGGAGVANVAPAVVPPATDESAPPPEVTPPPAPTPTEVATPPPPPESPADSNACPTGPETMQWSPEVLDGHVLPALRGGAGYEEPIDSQGRVPSTGGAVSFARYASMGKEYQEFYITMRWDAVGWLWNGNSTYPTAEDWAWYANRDEPLRVLVVNPRTGQSIVAVVLESGPAPWAGTPGGRNDQAQQALWQQASGGDGFVQGTPAGYNGRVAGFPPAAAQALGMEQWMFGGPENGGSGDELLYAWAPDQAGVPGRPTGLNAVAADRLLGHKGEGTIELPNAAETAAEVTAICEQLLDTNVSLDQVNTGTAPEVPYQYAQTPSSGPQPGAVALDKFIHDVWQTSDSNAYGIYSSTAQIDGAGVSLHAEGRAMDIGLDGNDPAQKARGDQVFAWTIKNARLLGVQEVIWYGQIWTSDNGLRAYTGANPHKDHLHIGLTWAAAKGEMPVYQLNLLDLRPQADGSNQK